MSDMDEPTSRGWQSIDDALAKLYFEQKPKHYAAVPPPGMGGSDFLNGVSIYQSQAGEPHFHFVTYGFSNLFDDPDKTYDGYSDWGFELTFRLKPSPLYQDPAWMVTVLQNLGRYVFTKGRGFLPGEYFPMLGKILLTTDTSIEAVAFTQDPELGEIETPNGRVQFLQLVGITDPEYQTLVETGDYATSLIDALRVGNPLLITDLER